MDRLSVGVFYFSAWSISTCLLHQYHYVNELKTWTEAQSYCRRHYTDLATIEDSSEVTQLINSVSDGRYSGVWIGVFGKVDWRWSDGYTGNESGHINWYSDWLELNFVKTNQYCAAVNVYEGWRDDHCTNHCTFICYSGTQCVYINQTLSWTDAQSYCRSNYVDLATVKNSSDNQMIQNIVPHDIWAWTGLSKNLNFYWSDGSNLSFTHWYSHTHPLGSSKIICGIASVRAPGRWRIASCDAGGPFVCHYTPPVVKKQAVKLRMKVEDSSVDLNDPVVRADILKQLQSKLNMTGVTLKWREQPDGKVFHKEKGRHRKKKKTEL